MYFLATKNYLHVNPPKDCAFTRSLLAGKSRVMARKYHRKRRTELLYEQMTVQGKFQIRVRFCVFCSLFFGCLYYNILFPININRQNVAGKLKSHVKNVSYYITKYFTSDEHIIKIKTLKRNQPKMSVGSTD